jgi:ParB-like chromosome segregation protein Spo0J
MKVDVTQLKPHPKNVELYSMDGSGIDELTASINDVGLLEPIVVVNSISDDLNDTGYTIISGHRRYLSVRNLKWKVVDVKLITIDKEDQQ